jgi:hypothetical protein
MSRTITLPDPLFHKLAQGADQRGLTVEGLLTFLSELVVLPDRPTETDLERSRRIEELFDKYRAGPLTEQDRAALHQLIDADYLEAIARADRRIAAQSARRAPAPGRRSSARRPRSSPRTGHRSRD